MVALYSQEEAVEQYVISRQFESEIKSAVQFCRDFEKTTAEAISYLMKRFGFSETRSKKEVEKYWNIKYLQGTVNSGRQNKCYRMI